MTELKKLFMSAPMSAKFGMIMILFYILVAIFAPLISPYGEEAIVGAKYLPYSWEFPLGTDNVGHDFLSRLIYGARNTVGIAFLTTVLTFLLGGFFGLMAATLGGWVDQILSRIVDIMMAIPPLISALLLLTIFETSVVSLVVIIAVLDSTRVFRLARAVSMGVVVLDYVEVSRLRGESLMYTIVREVLPNIAAPLAAEFGLRFCFVFLFISALSFLGLGLQPPTADWGSMVREHGTLISFGVITPLIPAAAIALLTVSVNFVVDWFLHKTSGLKE